MKKNTYYLYTNTDEFNNFLIYNMIYPKFDESNSFSFKNKGYIYLTSKRFSEKFINDKLRVGVMNPIILEINIKIPKNKKIVISENEILLKDCISFNSITKVYALDKEQLFFLYDDLFLFKSLLSNEKFEYGEEDCLYDSTPFTIECDNSKILEYKMWNKVQAAYMTRYVNSNSSLYDKKKKILAKSNLDNISFFKVTNIDQNDYLCNKYNVKSQVIFPNDVRENSTLVKFIESNVNELIYELCEKNKKDNIILNFDSKLARKLFEVSFEYSRGDDLLEKIDGDNDFLNFRDFVKNIKMKYIDDIFELKSILLEYPAERFVFLLDQIVNKSLDDAINYLSNFNITILEINNLLTLYGLAVGVENLNLIIKRDRPELLLYGYNKAKLLFKSVVINNVSNEEYYQLRNIEIENLIEDGFNYKCYHEKFETLYINNKITEILSKYLPKQSINKNIFKSSKASITHTTYLKLKKGEEYGKI